METTIDLLSKKSLVNFTVLLLWYAFAYSIWAMCSGRLASDMVYTVFFYILDRLDMTKYDIENFRAICFLVYFPAYFRLIVQSILGPLSLVSQRTRRRRMKVTMQRENLPRVSLIIPAYNEEVGILKTIRSVLNNDYPDLQVIIVNDGSTDKTHEIVTQFINGISWYNYMEKGLGTSLKYLKLENGGKSRAMNEALRYASGEIIMTTDGDTVVDERFIKEMVECFDNDPSVGAVSGNIVIADRSKPLGWILQLDFLNGFYSKRADSLFSANYIVGGAAAAYRKNALDVAGGFDPSSLTEDIDMSTRLLTFGYKCRYAHDAFVYTEPPSDLVGLCNQRLRWKYGRLQTWIKYKDIFFNVKHRFFYLTWFLLPIVAYGDLTLLIEPITLPLFWMATIVAKDSSTTMIIILSWALLTVLQILLERNRRFHFNLFFVVPTAYFLLYAVDMVESLALYRSLWHFGTRNQLKWQKWVRTGVPNNACLEANRQKVNRQKHI